MAATYSPLPIRTSRPRHAPDLLALWHLLSLDAPTVAVLWTLFTARLNHIPLGLATPTAMALAVWTLYAADRLLDTNHLASSPTQTHNLEPRHLFHHRHRPILLLLITLSTLLLAILLPHLPPPAIHIYLTLAALTAGYFLLIHAAPTRPSRKRIPKEIFVGLFFAAATFIPTISRAPTLRPALLPHALVFAAVCALNCLFIYAWEHPTQPHPHPLTRAAIRHLPCTAIALLTLAVILSALSACPLYPAACALSAAALLTLNHCRHRLSRLRLRSLADAALLTPILFLPFL